MINKKHYLTSMRFFILLFLKQFTLFQFRLNNLLQKKAFDCNLFLAKLHTYGFREVVLALFYLFLKRRKQNVKINSIYSKFKIIFSGVPKGLVLGPILVSIFINSLFCRNLHNIADSSIISAVEKEVLYLRLSEQL